MTDEDRLHAALGITADDLPISTAPINEWTTDQLSRAVHLLRECREIYGVGESRKLFPKIGMPMPPQEIIEPLLGDQRRH